MEHSDPMKLQGACRCQKNDKPIFANLGSGCKNAAYLSSGYRNFPRAGQMKFHISAFSQ
jgi:hypothetical protein